MDFSILIWIGCDLFILHHSDQILLYFILSECIVLLSECESEPYLIYQPFGPTQNSLEWIRTLQYRAPQPYRHSVELHRMVPNSYSVTVRYMVSTLHRSLPMCNSLCWMLCSMMARAYLEPQSNKEVEDIDNWWMGDRYITSKTVSERYATAIID